MKTRGFQLSQLTLQHFDFVEGLFESGVIDEKLAVELAQEGLKGIPKEAQLVLHPLNGEVLQLVVQHVRAGRRKIAIYRDGKGQRYVAADFAA